MMRTFVFILAIFSFAFSVSGQSGRKITPTPTPAVTIEEDAASYSESTPQKKRPARIWPTLRGDASPGTKASPGNSGTIAVSSGSIESEDVVQRVETNLITIPVSVFDRNGLYIPNLENEDFRSSKTERSSRSSIPAVRKALHVILF